MYTTVDANGYLKNGSGKRNSLWEYPGHSLAVFVLLSTLRSWKGGRGNGNGFNGASSLQCQTPQRSLSSLQIAFLLQTLQLHYFFICPVPVRFEQLAVAKNCG